MLGKNPGLQLWETSLGPRAGLPAGCCCWKAGYSRQPTSCFYCRSGKRLRVRLVGTQGLTWVALAVYTDWPSSLHSAWWQKGRGQLPVLCIFLCIFKQKSKEKERECSHPLLYCPNVHHTRDSLPGITELSLESQMAVQLAAWFQTRLRCV